jgi:hypothetical protein
MMVVVGAMVVGGVGVGVGVVGGRWWVVGGRSGKLRKGGCMENGRSGEEELVGVGLGGMVWCGDILLIAK